MEATPTTCTDGKTMHSARSCAQCPQGNGAAWCGGECIWAGGACVPVLEGVRCGAQTGLVEIEVEREVIVAESGPLTFGSRHCVINNNNATDCVVPENIEGLETFEAYCGTGVVFNGFCRDNCCCLEFGWCGNGPDFCSGSQGGTCGNGRGGDGVCSDSSLCCSNSGYCGACYITIAIKWPIG